jgi:hypothetical protein
VAPQIGKVFYANRFPPLGALIADAVRWAHDGPLPVEVEGPSTLHTSLRRLADGRVAVHCINLTGGERFFSQIVPLQNCTLRVRMPGASAVTATQVSTQSELAVTRDGDLYACVVPKIEKYDAIVLSARASEAETTS